MAPPKLNDYELNRLENIRRNNDMMAALKIQSKGSELQAKVKRTVKPKLKTETPVVTRSSLRTRGIPPDSNGLTRKSPNKFATLGPFPMKDAYKGIDDSDHSFIESLVGTSNKEFSEEDLNRTAKKKKIESSLDLESLSLYSDHSFSVVSVAPPKLNDYELNRLENIRRNNDMMAALKIQSKASELQAKVKRTVKPKLKTKTPVVTRSSLRTRGIPPDSNGLTRKSPNKFATLGPFSMKDAYKGIDDSDHSFIESLVGTSNKEFSEEDLNRTAKKKKIESSLDLESLSLYPENIVRVGPGSTSRRITQVQFLPSNNVKMIVAGWQVGDIGIWNVGQSKVFVYRPHQAIISGISVHPNCLSKIYTSCNNGFVRMMDAEKEIFDNVYNSSDGKGIYALSQPKNDANYLYIAEGFGSLTVWDNRIGKCSSLPHFALHQRRINTIDFDPENPHIAVTSSADGTACTWDFRCTGDKSNLTALKTFTYERALQSAYFSPSGCSIATTSSNNLIGIHKGVNFEDVAVVNLERIQKCFSTYRAIWGWDDSYLFTGSDTRGVSVVSTAQKATVMTLESPLVTACPQKLVAHPYEVGMLAGGTSGGEVYIWTSSQDF